MTPVQPEWDHRQWLSGGESQGSLQACHVGHTAQAVSSRISGYILLPTGLDRFIVLSGVALKPLLDSAVASYAVGVWQISYQSVHVLNQACLLPRHYRMRKGGVSFSRVLVM